MLGAAVVLGATGASVSAQIQPPDLDPATEDLADRVVESVGMVRSAGRNGSAWIAAPDTLITNLHVARASTGDIYVDFADGERVECYTAAADRDRDLAAVKCPTGDRPILGIASGRAAAGTPVVVVGYPEGVGPTITTGAIVSGSPTIRGIETVRYDARTQPGSSGSPVVEPSGRVVGVVTFSGGHGVPADDVTDLVENARGLPATKAAAEWRLRLIRSVVAVIVVGALYLIRRWRRDERPRPAGLAKAAGLGVALAFAASQLQFMLGGPTTYL